MNDLADRAARVIFEAMRAAIERAGQCSLALSGGSTPGPTFERLAGSEIDWSKVDVFQVDERVAPPGHPDRNLTLIEQRLCASIAGPQPRVHAMHVTTQRLDAAADEYAAELEAVCGRPPVIDVVHLGLGPDGHTASLVPNDPVLDIDDRWVAVTRPYGGYVRLTLTYPVLDNAALLVLVVEGEGKDAALKRVLDKDPSIPAGRLDGNLVVLA